MSQDKPDIVYVKCQLEGKPAEAYRELKGRAQLRDLLEPYLTPGVERLLNE